MKKFMLLTTIVVFMLLGCDTTQSTSGEPTVPSTTNSLTNTYWKLVELNGKPLPATTLGDRKEIFMVLSERDNKVMGNGGCNGFGGNFSTDSNGSKLTFAQLVRTKMACGSLQLEDQLFKVFETTNSYNLVNNELQLMQDQMAPHARFISIAGKTAN